MKNLSEIPIQFIKGVGPAKAKLLANLGISNVEDLLYFFRTVTKTARNSHR